MKMAGLYVIRQICRKPWQTVINLAAVAAGVGIVLAIDLSNSSAERAFKLSTQSVSGGTTHRIEAEPSGLDESVYRGLKIELGLRDAFPVVSGNVRLTDNKSYRLLGIDPLALSARKSVLSASVSFDASPLSLIADPGTGFIPDSFAKDPDSGRSKEIQLLADNRISVLKIIGSFTDKQKLFQDSIITDISTAQDILGMYGKLSWIDLTLDDEESARVKKYLSAPVRLTESLARSNAMEEMTRAFRTNLTALSLLALVIGGFLIYNIMTISVLQRNGEMATLRTLGTSRHELFCLVMGEAFVLAFVGIVIGLVVGTGLGHYLLKLASRTIDDLYFVREIQEVYLGAWSYAKAAIMGLFATFFATIPPAWSATRISPELTRSRYVLESGVHSRNRYLAIAGVTLLSMSIAVLVLSKHSLVSAFAAMFLFIVSFSLMVPAILVILVKYIRHALGTCFGLVGTIAGRSILVSLSRTRIAVAALAIAIAATIGISIMIDSFRQSVESWLGNYLDADIYISQSGNGSQESIDPALIERLADLPEVDSITGSKRIEVWSGGSLLRLHIVDSGEKMFINYIFRDEGDTDRWSGFYYGQSVIVSESYAYHNNISRGGSISLQTDQGENRFEVAGIYQDYSSSQGVVTMHRNAYEKYWGPLKISNLSIALQPGVETDNFVNRLNRDLLSGSELHARSELALRRMSMEIFDRTFAITEVLRTLTVIIAVAGILGVLMAIQLERKNEFAVLRTVGLTPAGLISLLLLEGGTMGLLAGILSVPPGIVLAMMLIHVINRRSFGWSMEALIEPKYLLAAVFLGLVSGLLAAFYPAWSLSRSPPVAGFHND